MARDIRRLAVRMFQVMGCEGYARVDFFLTPADKLIANARELLDKKSH